jgi:serine/threonine-protein kinase RIM15
MTIQIGVLLAAASLSHVVEWWEEEKQFWNFDDNNDEQDEALLFVMKRVDDHIPPPVQTPRLAPEEDPRLHLSRPTSQGKQPRDEVQSSSLMLPESSGKTYFSNETK